MVNWIEISALGTFTLAFVTFFIFISPKLNQYLTRPTIKLTPHTWEIRVHSPEQVVQVIPPQYLFSSLACFIILTNKKRYARKIKRYSVRIFLRELNGYLKQVDDRSTNLSHWGSIHDSGGIDMSRYSPDSYLERQITQEQRTGIPARNWVYFLLARTAESSDKVKFEVESGLSCYRKIDEMIEFDLEVEVEDVTETYHHVIRRHYLMKAESWHSVKIEGPSIFVDQRL